MIEDWEPQDCFLCCRPAHHNGDHCYLCLQRRRADECDTKRAYIELWRAQAAADRTGLYLKVYRCPFVIYPEPPHWHVGHRRVVTA